MARRRGSREAGSLGNAEFRIRPGNYILRGQRAAFTVYYGQLPDGEIQTVFIALEDKAKSVTFPVAWPGSLSGYVRDELGDPVPNIPVHLVRAYCRDSALVFGLALATQTDDRGYYRISGIKPGAYILCGIPSQNLRALEIGPVDSRSRTGGAITSAPAHRPSRSQVRQPSCGFPLASTPMSILRCPRRRPSR